MKQLYTPLDILIYANLSYDIPIKIDLINKEIKIKDRKWDCTFSGMQGGALDLIAAALNNFEGYGK